MLLQLSCIIYIQKHSTHFTEAVRLPTKPPETLKNFDRFFEFACFVAPISRSHRRDLRCRCAHAQKSFRPVWFFFPAEIRADPSGYERPQNRDRPFWAIFCKTKIFSEISENSHFFAPIAFGHRDRSQRGCAHVCLRFQTFEILFFAAIRLDFSDKRALPKRRFLEFCHVRSVGFCARRIAFGRRAPPTGWPNG